VKALLVIVLFPVLVQTAGAQSKTLPRPGEVFHVDGRTAFLIEPPVSARHEGPLPLVWYAPTLEGLPGEEETWKFDRFLAAGIAIGGIDVGESYGSPQGRASYQAFYRVLTTERDYAEQPVLLARSRGGLMLYNWAVEHPASVGGIAGIYPVCNLASYPGVVEAAPAFDMTPDELEAKLEEHNPIDRLGPLAEARVPVLHIHGDQDTAVPLSANSAELGKRYASLGGPVEISVIPGQGHSMWSGWFQSQELTDFVVVHALAGRHARAGTAEETDVARWNGHRRLDFVVSGKPARLVIPEHPAPGRPWVWRARFPDFHTGADLILLERGFHIAHVDTEGMLGGLKAMAIWDVFYDTLREEHGLAARPALEGVSRGGLFVYHWAARHPDRVACIYTDTAVCDIRSWPLGHGAGRGHEPTWQHLLRELELTEDEARAYAFNPIELLEPIVSAKIPILGIVSLNDEIVPPGENTFVVVQRYRALGGDIRIMEVAQGTASSNGHHFAHPDPLRPADFIERHASTTPDPGGYFSLRGTLENCRARFEDEKRGRVAFLGGSITHNPGWRDAVCAYLRTRFPETEFDFVAAGIPSMGSTPGAFRLARDVFDRGPVDLLFQEAAVNDSTNRRTATEMTRGAEGILRHARSLNPALDVVLLHFVDPDKLTRYRAGEVPLVIRQHEAVAAHYGVSTVHLAREVTERIDAGQFTWEEDFVNLHPSPFGQRLYAASLRRLLSQCWDEPRAGERASGAHAMPAPLDPFSYDAGELAAPAEAGDLAGFELVPSCDPRSNEVGGGVREGFVDVPMLVGTEPGDSLSFSFEGRAVGAWVAAGPDAGTIEYRIDGGPWRSQDLFTRWSGGLHLPWIYVLEAELDGEAHELELRIATTKNPRSKGHACRIAHFVVNR
jgi:sialidase-1